MTFDLDPTEPERFIHPERDDIRHTNDIARRTRPWTQAEKDDMRAFLDTMAALNRGELTMEGRDSITLKLKNGKYR